MDWLSGKTAITHPDELNAIAVKLIEQSTPETQESVLQQIHQLLRNGVNLNAPTNCLVPALKNPPILPFILRFGVNPLPVMQELIQLRDVYLMKIVVTMGSFAKGNGANSYVLNEYLTKAVKKNDCDVVKFLLDSGVNPGGDYPISYAIHKNHRDMVRLIVSYKPETRHALITALDMKSRGMVEILLKAPMHPNTLPDALERCLIRLDKNELAYMPIAELLIQHGVKPDVVTMPSIWQIFANDTPSLAMSVLLRCGVPASQFKETCINTYIHQVRTEFVRALHPSTVKSSINRAFIQDPLGDVNIIRMIFDYQDSIVTYFQTLEYNLDKLFV